MAGDWIKMRGNLWDDPRVARIVDMTDSSEAAVIGALYWLWATADQHTEDGLMLGLTLKSIDRKTGVIGFAEALCAVGWITDQPEGIRIVNFIEHNGSSAKNRLETAKRVAKHRLKEPEEKQHDHACKRISIPKAVIESVMSRDGHKCVYCQRANGYFSAMETRVDGILHMDHVIPVSKGGSCDESNLVSACRKCNMIKSNRNPDECGFNWPEINGQRIGNANRVTEAHNGVSSALAREEKRREEKSNTGEGEIVVFEEREPIEPPPALKTGAICIVLKSEGVGSVNPSHPELLALIDAGAQVGHFAEAARASVAKGKPNFSYVLATVKGQMRDAAALAVAAFEVPFAGAKNAIESFSERDRRKKREDWEAMTGRRWDEADGGRTGPTRPAEMAGEVVDVFPENARISQ